MLLILAAQETAKKKGFWILDPLYIALGTLLAWFYGIIPNYGVAIILLTAAVCVLRMPLVAKQVKSQREMQRIQPELKRIQTKYKDDPQKRNEEMMKLYKEHNVNPFAGCLPLILQMPLFIVLYRLILNLSAQPPKHIPSSSRLYRDLVASGGKLQAFGMDLAQHASKVHGIGKLLPYIVLIAMVVGTGLYQQRQMTARMPKGAVNTQVQIMGKVFPVFLGFISFNVPAGVVLYFLVSNLFQIGQQAVLFRRQEPPPGTGKTIDTKMADRSKGEGDTKGGGVPSGAPSGSGGGMAAFLNRLMRGPAEAASSNGEAAADAGESPGGQPGGGNGAPGTQPRDGAPSDGAQATGAGTTRKPNTPPAKSQPANRNQANRNQANRNQANKSQAAKKAQVNRNPAARGQPGKAANQPAKRKPAPAQRSGTKPAPPAPTSSGGFFSRLFGGGSSKTDGRSAGAKGSTTRPAKSPSNGRASSSGGTRSSGRAQPKGQTASKSKSRNSRKGK